MKFGSKPTTIDAIQWTDDVSIDQLYEWAGIDRAQDEACAHGARHFEQNPARLSLKVLSAQGYVMAKRFDWIIRELDGRGFYPCDPYLFAEKYEPESERLPRSPGAPVRDADFAFGILFELCRVARPILPHLQADEMPEPAREEALANLIETGPRLLAMIDAWEKARAGA